jgi:hypothetical protein
MLNEIDVFLVWRFNKSINPMQYPNHKGSRVLFSLSNSIKHVKGITIMPLPNETIDSVAKITEKMKEYDFIL